MKVLKTIITYSACCLLVGCGEYKQVLRGNKVYRYVNKQNTPNRGNDMVIEHLVEQKLVATLSDKTNRYELKIRDNEPAPVAIDTAYVYGDDVGSFIGTENIFYTSENRKLFNKKIDTAKYFEPGSFKFYYGKFSLTGLTIPLKFRKGVGDELLNPSTLETGFNVNFAPSYRLNWSSFNPKRKFLGANLTNYSITVGGLLGIGGTDLKTKTNAPGLLSDRKSTMLTYGGTVIFGLNSFGIGYAVGFDNVLGAGSKYWVYQNRIWHGIVVSVDLIK